MLRSDGHFTSTLGVNVVTPFVVTAMSPFLKSSTAADMSVLVSRFTAASVHAMRYELDKVCSSESSVSPGTIATRDPMSAMTSADLRRGLT